MEKKGAYAIVEGVKRGHSTKEIANYFNFIKTSSDKGKIQDNIDQYLA